MTTRVRSCPKRSISAASAEFRLQNPHQNSSYVKFFLLPLVAILILFVSFFPAEVISLNNRTFASLAGIITARVTINPLDVAVSVPEEMEAGRSFSVKAEVINKGGEAIRNVRAEIHLPEGIVLLSRDSTKRVGAVASFHSKKVSWMARGREIGTHIISVSASGEVGGYIVNAEDSDSIEITTPFYQQSSFPHWLREFFEFLRLGE